MRSFGATLNTALAGPVINAAWLLTITLRDGVTVYRLAEWDQNVTVSAQIFYACPLNIGSIPQQSTKDSTRIDIDIMGSSATGLIPTLTLWHGLLDGADVTLWHSDASANKSAYFVGKVQETRPATEVGFFTLEIAGKIARSRSVIIDTINAACPFHLGDLNTCGVDLDGLKMTAAIVSVSASGYDITIGSYVDSLALDFANGGLVFTSGQLLNKPFWEIRAASLPVVSLQLPMVPAATPGDTVYLFPGCDRTLGTGGCKKFKDAGVTRSNGTTGIENYGGFPWVPGQDLGAVTTTPSGPGLPRPDQWSGTDKGTLVTRSNNNYTATTSGIGIHYSVRSETGKTTGLWYFELDCSSTSGDPNFQVGVATTGAATNIVYANDGIIFSNGGFVAFVPGWSSAGALVQFKVNLDANEISFAVNGGGYTTTYSLAAVGTPLYAHFDADNPAICTLLTTERQFQYAIPIGYSAWSS